MEMGTQYKVASISWSWDISDAASVWRTITRLLLTDMHKTCFFCLFKIYRCAKVTHTCDFECQMIAGLSTRP